MAAQVKDGGNARDGPSDVEAGVPPVALELLSRSPAAVHSPASLSHHHLKLLGTRGPAPSAAAAAAAAEEDVAGGMLWYGASSVFYAGMAVCSKVLQNGGYPVWEITFFRALVILAVSLPAILTAGVSPWGVRRGLLLLRGTLGYSSLALFFSACYFLPIATATTLTFLAPLIVALLSPALLREAVSPAAAAVIPLCLAGVVLITQPAALFGGGGAALSAAGLLIGIAQPFFGASTKMVIRELRKTEETHVIIFYLVLCSLAASGVGCALSWRRLVTPATWRDRALLLALGACGYGNQLCTTKGLAKGRAAPVMSMHFCCLVFTQLAGVLLFEEYPGVAQAAGMALIVACVLWHIRHEARAQQR